MHRLFRLRNVIAAALMPLMVAACFSNAPTRSGEGDQSGTPSTGSPSSSPSSSTPSSTSTSGEPSTNQGHRGVPGTTSSQSTGATGLPDPTTTDGGADGDGGSSDIRVATADSGAAGGASDTADSGTGGMSGEPAEVSVAEALEGANAAVDAAAGAVAEAEATIERAREEIESDGGIGGDGEETFDPWAKPGSAAADDSAETDGQASPADSSDQTAADSASASRSESEDPDSDSFDPFAGYGDEEGDQGSRRIPAANSLETAEDAVAAARAALNRARRSLIRAAGAGSDGADADAEAVQLEAARAAMAAAAEAVIASAIAVMAASNAMYDGGEVDAEASEAAEEMLAAGIEKVVAIMQRDMRNAAEALEATGELLSAAGALIGMVVGIENDQQETGDEEVGEKRVAALERELDKSLTVFDDRMESESRSIGGSVVSDDSEIATLNVPDGQVAGTRQAEGTGYRNDSGASRRDEEMGDQSVEARYEMPDVIAPTETEQIVLAEGQAQDDDIVARQLREAAMAETDPELREALWREYRNYKESLESGEAEAN